MTIYILKNIWPGGLQPPWPLTPLFRSDTCHTFLWHCRRTTIQSSAVHLDLNHTIEIPYITIIYCNESKFALVCSYRTFIVTHVEGLHMSLLKWIKVLKLRPSYSTKNPPKVNQSINAMLQWIKASMLCCSKSKH